MSGRVSAQSLALACVCAAVDLQPSLLPSLQPLLPFTSSSSDPKLKSRAMVVSQRGRWKRGGEGGSVGREGVEGEGGRVGREVEDVKEEGVEVGQGGRGR